MAKKIPARPKKIPAPKPVKRLPTRGNLEKELASARKQHEHTYGLYKECVEAKQRAEFKMARVYALIANFDARAQQANELRKVAKQGNLDEVEAGTCALTWQRAANLLRKAYHGGE